MTELRQLLTDFLTHIHQPNADLHTLPDCVEDDKTIYRDGTRLKQTGAYPDAAQLYTQYMQTQRELYPAMLLELYKVAASGGALLEAMRIWTLANQTATALEQAGEDVAAIRAQLQIHGARFANSLGTPELLRDYLMTLSNNPAYQLPADYSQLIQQIQ